MMSAHPPYLRVICSVTVLGARGRSAGAVAADVVSYLEGAGPARSRRQIELLLAATLFAHAPAGLRDDRSAGLDGHGGALIRVTAQRRFLRQHGSADPKN
jgi:hypothetical protein